MRDGRCQGVVVQRAGGEVHIAASAVLIADGGFQGNAAMFRQYIGPRPDLVLQRGAGTGMGDGIRLAAAAGAALVGMKRFYGHVLGRDALDNADLWPYPQIDAIAAAAIVVDRNGQRVTDEGGGGVWIANALAQLDDPAGTSVILDAEIWERAGREAQIPPNPQLEKHGGTVHRADTLAALAAKAGLPAEALTATVIAYNAALAESTTASLGPPRTVEKVRAAPIVKPPFLAIPLSTGITYTMGGIATDAHGRVKREAGGFIGGLYAAGATTGGLEGAALQAMWAD